MFLSVFRFISIAAILLLIFDIQVKTRITETIKPRLVILADNSSSIKYKKQDSLENSVIEKLINDQKISKKYNVVYFNFGKELKSGKLLNFHDTETNIYRALSNVDELFKDEQALIILITDGNQTYGRDYAFFKSSQSIIPVVLGDTTHFNDLFISNLNVNSYTYLKHRFPVELIVNFDGVGDLSSELVIYNEKKVVFKKAIRFSGNHSSEKISFLLPALRKGKNFYRAEIKPHASEKNILNNVREFSIEVLDEQSQILLLYDFIHPDIGFWKRTIETEELRKVKIENINNFNGDISNYQFVILYQPNEKFKNILSRKINLLIQTGTHTNWEFLNRNQEFFRKESLSDDQLASPVYNPEFSTFRVKDIKFDHLPPLKNIFGKLTFKLSYQALLFQEVNNIVTTKPLIAIMEKANRRIVLIDGENIFAWRNYSFVSNNNFENFDAFTNNLFQFLQNRGNRKTLEVQSRPIYFNNEKIVIKAVNYDANYYPDTISQLEINLKNKETGFVQTRPLFLKEDRYEVVLQDLKPGIYEFKISVKDRQKSFKGKFKVLYYNQEQHLIKPDYERLRTLADRHNGRIFLGSQSERLIAEITDMEKFKPVQKQLIKKQSLIDWKWLLSLIILSLSFEWFIRKYHGLI